MAYYSLRSNITITNPVNNQALVFEYVTEVEINSSWKNLTDTATIKLPRKLKLKDKLLQDVIKKGHRVTIQLGYAPDLVTEFTGYVSGVKATIPVEITCEDEMWKWKQVNINKSFPKDTTLKTVIKYLVAQTGYEGAEEVGTDVVGDLLFDNISAAKCLKQLREEHGAVSYFRNNTLVSGLLSPYPIEFETVNYHFQKNIIENDLEYLYADDVLIKVKATSNLANGEEINVSVGDDEGETRTLHYYNLNKADLTKRATAEIELLKYDGYRGSITSFGIPHVRHGDALNVVDDLYPERSGLYYADEVITRFGVDGMRREVTIGRKKAA